MRCLSQAESKEWLASFNVTMGQNYCLHFPEIVGRKERILKVQLPNEPLKLSYFAERVVEWLPKGHQCMLWLSNWNTYPPHQSVFFEMARRGCGEDRHIIDAPGHLFESDISAVDKEYGESGEQSLLAGFVLLTICYGWNAYLVIQDSDSRVVLGDEYIGFCTGDDEKFDDAFELVHTYNLKFKEIELKELKGPASK